MNFFHPLQLTERKAPLSPKVGWLQVTPDVQPAAWGPAELQQEATAATGRGSRPLRRHLISSVGAERG